MVWLWGPPCSPGNTLKLILSSMSYMIWGAGRVQVGWDAFETGSKGWSQNHCLTRAPHPSGARRAAPRQAPPWPAAAPGSPPPPATPHLLAGLLVHRARALAVEDHRAAGAAQRLVGGGGHHVWGVGWRGSGWGGECGGWWRGEERGGAPRFRLAPQSKRRSNRGQTPAVKAPARTRVFEGAGHEARRHEAADVGHVGQQPRLGLFGRAGRAGVVEVG
jgi:hypothetical protein